MFFGVCGAAVGGRWAVNQSTCGIGGSTRTAAALVVNDISLSNWKMYKLGQTAYIQARCWDSNDIPVTLEPRGDRMRVTWDRGKAEDLQRCK